MLRNHRLHIGLTLLKLVGNVPSIGEDLNRQSPRFLGGRCCGIGSRRSRAPREDAAQNELEKEVLRLHVMSSTADDRA